jgi:hypothetical protein
MAQTIKLKAGWKGAVALLNYVPQDRELVLEKDDSGKYVKGKVGDGVTAYSALPYSFEDGGEENVLEGVQLNGTDLTIDASKKVNIVNATGSIAGLLSASDKTKLDTLGVTAVTYLYSSGDDSSKITVTTTSGSADYTLQKASILQSGLMTKEDVAILTLLEQKVEVLTGAVTLLGGTSLGADPVADATLTTEAETLKGWTIEQGDGIKNNDSGVLYVRNGTTWINMWVQDVAVATNTALGVVKGDSSTAGKVYVETDGSMTLNGYDDLVDGISDLAVDMGAIETRLDGNEFQSKLTGTGFVYMTGTTVSYTDTIDGGVIS